MDIEDDAIADSKVLSAYLEDIESEVTSEVLKLKRRILKDFFGEVFPGVPPSAVEIKHVREYLNKLKEKDLKYSSRRRYMEVLSSFFRYALQKSEFEDIVGNPPKIVLEEYPRYPDSESTT